MVSIYIVVAEDEALPAIRGIPRHDPQVSPRIPRNRWPSRRWGTSDNFKVDKNFRASVLVVCRPFSPDASALAVPAKFYFVDPEVPFFDGLADLASAYRHLVMEKSLADLYGEELPRLERPCTVVDDIVVADGERPLRSAFLVSSDTHAHFVLPIEKHFDEVLNVVPHRRNKDEGAAEVLTQNLRPFIELAYAAESRTRPWPALKRVLPAAVADRIKKLGQRLLQ